MSIPTSSQTCRSPNQLVRMTDLDPEKNCQSQWTTSLPSARRRAAVEYLSLPKKYSQAVALVSRRFKTAFRKRNFSIYILFYWHLQTFELISLASAATAFTTLLLSSTAHTLLCQYPVALTGISNGNSAKDTHSADYPQRTFEILFCLSVRAQSGLGTLRDTLSQRGSVWRQLAKPVQEKIKPAWVDINKLLAASAVPLLSGDIFKSVDLKPIAVSLELFCTKICTKQSQSAGIYTPV